MLKRDFRLFLRLFASTFYLSLFTIGGGYVMISLMKKKFVDDLGWLEDKEMLDITAISQSAPGAIAVNGSILIGYKIAGVAGAFTAAVGTVLPPLLVITGISYIYDMLRGSTAAAEVMAGLRAGIAAVMADVVIRMFLGIRKEKDLFMMIVMAASFIAAFVFDIDVVIILLGCGLCGLVWAYRKKFFGRKRP